MSTERETRHHVKNLVKYVVLMFSCILLLDHLFFQFEIGPISDFKKKSYLMGLKSAFIISKNLIFGTRARTIDSWK